VTLRSYMSVLLGLLITLASADCIEVAIAGA
jgi:hypothetical protein